MTSVCQILDTADPTLVARQLREPRYRPDIDGLRAIAVTSVVFYHLGLFPFRSGFVGVDIFFVISGYLIGGIVIRNTTEGNFDFIEFYARRARRILPALITVVLLTCTAGWFILDATEFHDVGATATTTLLAVSNFSFWRFQDYFANDARLRPLLMTWSLGVEEQFYLFFPFLVIGAMRLASTKLIPVLGLVTSASFILSAWWTASYPAAAFYLLPARAWELGAGALLVACEIRLPKDLLRFSRSGLVYQALPWLGLTLLVFSITIFDEATPFPGIVALLPILGTTILISTQHSWVNVNLFSVRPLVFVGLISYSWYLWHWPLLSYLRIIVPNPPTIQMLVTTAALSFAVAVLSWRFIELPFRRIRRPSRLVLQQYAVALFIALAGPTAIKLGKGLPERLSAKANQIEAVGAARGAGQCLASFTERKPNLSSECVSGYHDEPSVALIGDSHAGALAQAFRELAGRERLGFKIFTKSSCPPLLDVSVSSLDYPEFWKFCAEFMSEARRLASDPSVKVVVLAGLWSGPLGGDGKFRYVDLSAPTRYGKESDLLRKGLGHMTSALMNSGKRVIVLEDTPYWQFDPLRLELAKEIPVRDRLFKSLCLGCSKMFAGLIRREDLRNRETAHLIQAMLPEMPSKVEYLDLFNRFCDSEYCMFQHSGELLFVDKSHLSLYGARYAFEGLEISNYR